MDITYLCITVVLKHLPDERIKGIPVSINDVSANGPQIAEDEGGADEGVELGRVLVEVNLPSLAQHQGLQQLTQCHHLAEVHLQASKQT